MGWESEGKTAGRGLGVLESRGRWADGRVSGGTDGVSGGAAEAQRSPRHARGLNTLSGKGLTWLPNFVFRLRK